MSRKNNQVKGGMFSGSPTEKKYSTGKMLEIGDLEFQFVENKSSNYAMEQHLSNIQELFFKPNSENVELSTEKYLDEIKTAYRTGFNMCLRCLSEDLQNEVKKAMDNEFFKNGRCLVSNFRTYTNDSTRTKLPK